MRLSFVIALFLLPFLVKGQRIDFRNDSLFINNYYVDRMTSKITLDSLMNDKGKLKKVAGKHRPGSKETLKWTKIIYKEAGLIFSKPDDDSSTLSVAIKLHKNTNPEVDRNNMPTNTFNGDLFIDINYMNDKRKISELQKLKNCSVSFKESPFASHTGIVSCTISYQKREIRALFDFQTNELTCLFID